MLAPWGPGGPAVRMVGVGLMVHWASITVRRSRRELVGVVVLLGLLGGVSLFALVPLDLLVVLFVAALAVTNVAATLPGRVAGRVRPAVVLRAE